MKINLLFLLSIVLSSSIDYPNHNSSMNWITLNDDDIWVGYTETVEIDWCRTTSKLPFSIDKISQMIEDLENYYQIFDRVKSSKIVVDDVVHIRIDMPFPISDRDYIVRYTTSKKDEAISYKFKAASDIQIDINDDCIRLVNAAGEWYLKRVDDSTTEVVYTWNGELRGDFPSWALTRAWRTQGLEMINWLKESLGEKHKD